MGCVTGPKFGVRTHYYTILDPCCNFKTATTFHVHVYLSDSQKSLSPYYLFINGSAFCIPAAKFQNVPQMFPVVEMENETNNGIIKTIEIMNHLLYVWWMGALWSVPSKHSHYNYYETETDTANKIYKSKTAVISEIGTCLETL